MKRTIQVAIYVNPSAERAVDGQITGDDQPTTSGATL
jgi:hypothetical protein